jgi:hypothetical protein
MTARKVWGTYNPAKKANGTPSIDWQYAESVQDDIQMRSDGKKIRAKSQALIKKWIKRWAQEDASSENELEPSEAFSDNEMDLD